MTKMIFSFDDKSAKKIKNKKNILGGKGANLGEMGRLGLPVPPDLQSQQRFVIFFTKTKKVYPQRLLRILNLNLRILRKKQKKIW